MSIRKWIKYQYSRRIKGISADTMRIESFRSLGMEIGKGITYFQIQ